MNQEKLRKFQKELNNLKKEITDYLKKVKIQPLPSNPIRAWAGYPGWKQCRTNKWFLN